ncbi:Mycoplamsa peptidase, DUF31 containing-protein [[Mycoplasma] cavipharyngis]|uniref:DUF31 family putative serine protease n=1 Tax=[Mycoplasma] cavipharyngis TaxID=92757 RepID=UPI003704AC30
MNKFKKFWLSLFSLFPTTFLLTACFSSQVVNVSGFEEGLKDIDVNIPGNSRNISVPITEKNHSGAEYLRTHNISLYLQDNKNPDNKINSSGFIINTFSDQNDSSSTNNQKINLLVGTNLHVVKQLFPSVDLSKINQQENVKLSDLASNNNKDFYLSFFDYDTSDAKNVGPLKADFNLYQENNNNNANDAEKRNVYQKIKNSNVELVYTATNLAINKKLFKFDQNINLLNQFRDQIAAQKQEEIEWIDSYNPTLVDPFTKSTNFIQKRTEFNFAVDFAVLKLTFDPSEQPEWLKKFNQKMQTNDVNYSAIPTNRSFILNSNLSTPSYLIGGFSALNQNAIINEIVNNADPYFALKINQNITEKFANEISAENFNDYFEIKNLNQKYLTISKINLTHNVNNGLLIVDATIQNKAAGNNNYYKSKTFTQVISGFKSLISAPVNIQPNKKPFKDGLPVVKWVEAEVNSGTFSDESIFRIANNLWNDKVYSRLSYFDNQAQINQAKLNNNPNVLNYGDQNFLAINSNIKTPSLDLKPGSSGSLAISDKWIKSNAPGTGYNLIGIYSGADQYHNPLSSTIRKTGRIVLFSSAFRYELFQAKNNLSKPSLCDVLNNKKITEKLANSLTTCPVSNDETN